MTGSRARLRRWSGISFVVFAACCAVILWFHQEVSESLVATYLLLGITGISAIIGPVLGGRAFFEWLTQTIRKVRD